VVGAPITNWNYSRSFIGFPDMYLSVPYLVDPNEVKTLITRVLDGNTNVLKNPRPVIRLEEFGEHGYIFLIRGFLSPDNAANQHDIASDVRFSLIKALKDRNIEVVAPAHILYTRV